MGVPAADLIRRFAFLDVESRRVVDFFLLGWSGRDQTPVFNLNDFQACRTTLRSVGVREFGGYADLILFDAWLRGEKVELDFTRAIHIDLAEAIAKQRILNIGGFLQSSDRHGRSRSRACRQRCLECGRTDQ